MHHVTVFWQTPHFWEGFGTFGSFFLAFLKWGWPPIRMRWARWRNWTLVRDGRAAIPNVSPAILAIPERLKNLDDGQLKIINDISSYKAEHTAQVAEINASVTRTERKIDKLFENGRGTNFTGDLIARMAEKQGVYLPNPEESSHDRREGDVSP
jgi:hypothetical protein